MKTREIILFALVVILFSGLVLMVERNLSVKKKLNQTSGDLIACQISKTTVTYIDRWQEVDSGLVMKLYSKNRPKREPVYFVDTINDIVYRDTCCCSPGIVETIDSLSNDKVYMKYRIESWDSLRSFTVLDLKTRCRDVIYNHIIHDTVTKKVPASSLWLYVSGQATIPFKSTSMMAGVEWTMRDKWGLGAGAGYSWYWNKPVVEARILFNIHSRLK